MIGPRAIVIGCSAGGMRALRVLLSGVRADLDVPLFAVCHTGSEDVTTLCELIAASSAIPVREARERHLAAPGTAYIAPGGYHLLVEENGRMALSTDERVTFARPAIDVLFDSAAGVYGNRLVGIVMTGANHDGAAGLARIRQRGGIAIVQEPCDAEAPTMPQAALDIAGADHCVALQEIAPLLNRMCP